MGFDEDLKKNYAIGKHIFISSMGDSNEKYTACRGQAATLQHLCRNMSTAEQHASLGHHFAKHNYEDHADFLQERAKAVEAYLGNVQELSKPPTSLRLYTPDQKLRDLDGIKELMGGSYVDRYQICGCNGIKVDSLRTFRGVKESKDCSVTSENHDESAMITSRGKHTLSAFLTANHSPSRKSRAEESRNNTVDYSDISKQQHLQQSKSTESNHENLLTFRTAREELMLQNMKKRNDLPNRSKSYYHAETPLFNYASTKKSLGARRTVNSNFVLPLKTDDSPSATTTISAAFTMNRESPSLSNTSPSNPPDSMALTDARLANIDPKMVELITNEIMHKNQSVDWGDIAGLDYAKSIIKEAVVYPLLRPDIFTGLRRPPRGILLFGPPGTGKTLIGKCIASKSKSTFFSISASSLTSKWIGDGEKMVRALFAVAAVHQPSVVFIDEIDSLLSQRSETEHESSRRLKTEFLVQLDGAATSDDDRILIVGATNRPHELDEAVRRRLVRRLYIPLPEIEARIQILANLLQTVCNNLTSEEIRQIGDLTDGYSGADMESLCREASMEPIRSIPADEILSFKVENVRPIKIEDFKVALHNVRPSISPKDLKQYEDWNRIYGAGK